MQSLNCERRKSLAALFTERSIGRIRSVQFAGISTTLTLWLSSNVRIDDVICALKLSKINNEPWSSSQPSVC